MRCRTWTRSTHRSRPTGTSSWTGSRPGTTAPPPRAWSTGSSALGQDVILPARRCAPADPVLEPHPHPVLAAGQVREPRRGGAAAQVVDLGVEPLADGGVELLQLRLHGAHV